MPLGRTAVDALEFCIAALATWRLAHFLYAEDGPWRAAARLRRTFAAQGFATFSCFLCLSAWPALAVALLVGGGWRHILLLWLALSAAASLIERVAFPETFLPVPEFVEDKETSDVLRQD